MASLKLWNSQYKALLVKFNAKASQPHAQSTKPSVVEKSDHVEDHHEDHHQLQLELMVGLAVDDMLGPPVDELDQLDHHQLELMVGLAVDDMLGPAVDELDQDHQLSHQVDAEANDQYGKSSHKVL